MPAGLDALPARIPAASVEFGEEMTA
jgi:hypothetical protein